MLEECGAAMTSQWNSKALGKNLDALQSGVMDDPVVILMQGKNPFGDRIYSYLKLTVRDLMRLQSTIQSGVGFNPSDFGSVVAAGKGDPTPEIKAEVAAMYHLLDNFSNIASSDVAPPPKPKAWDEF